MVRQSNAEQKEIPTKTRNAILRHIIKRSSCLASLPPQTLMPAIFKMEPRRSKRLAGQPPSIGNPDDTTWPKSKRKKARNSQSAARPRTLLVDLPTEILDFISQAVLEKVVRGTRFPDHPQDLISLGRTCQHLHHITQRILYRQIIASRTNHGAARRINLFDLVPPLESFRFA